MPLNADVARQQYTRYTYARDAGHLVFIDKADKCYAYTNGDQYSPADKNALREARRPGLTINKILGTLSNILGEQIDLRTEIAYKGRYGAPSGNADTLTKLFRYISDKNMLNWTRSDVFCDGAITSRGYFDVKMNFDRNLAGDIEITKLNPKNVIPDPDANEYDPDSWNDVIITRWLTADDVEYMYSKDDADILRTRSASAWAYGYDSIDRIRDRFAGTQPTGMYITDDAQSVLRLVRVIDRQYRKLAKLKYFIDVRTGDKQEVPKSFDRDRIAAILSASGGKIIVDEQIGKRIRWTVTADDLVLHDDWSPYKHFTVVPYFPYFLYGRTIGLVENLLDPQELLNKSTSQELHVVNTVANSGWKIRKGSLQNMTMEELEEYGSKSGVVLELDDVTHAEKITPNQIPQGLSELSRKGENYIKSISMRGDAQTGMARADVSADQIEAQKANSDIGLRKPLDNLARTDFILARNVLALVQEFVTDPRAMNITHNALTGEQQQITINWPDPNTGELMNDVTMGEYDITVVSQPAKQTLEQTQFEQAAYLKEKLGVPIPNEFLIENSNLVNKTGLVAALKEAEQSEVNQMKQKMDLMGGQLELANMKADVSKSEADAVLKKAKAAHAVAQTQEIAGADPTKNAEMELERAKAEQEMMLKQQAHEQDMEIEREKQALELQLRQKEAEDDRLLKRAQAIAAMREQPAEQGSKSQSKPKEK